jgi:hypothetical protein
LTLASERAPKRDSLLADSGFIAGAGLCWIPLLFWMLFQWLGDARILPFLIRAVLPLIALLFLVVVIGLAQEEHASAGEALVGVLCLLLLPAFYGGFALGIMLICRCVAALYSHVRGRPSAGPLWKYIRLTKDRFFASCSAGAAIATGVAAFLVHEAVRGKGGLFGTKVPAAQLTWWFWIFVAFEVAAILLVVAAAAVTKRNQLRVLASMKVPTAV